jgi:hypothetical protein
VLLETRVDPAISFHELGSSAVGEVADEIVNVYGAGYFGPPPTKARRTQPRSPNAWRGTPPTPAVHFGHVGL